MATPAAAIEVADTLPSPIEQPPAPPPPATLWQLIAEASTWDIPDTSAVNAAREHWRAQTGLFELLGQRAVPALQYITAEIQQRDLPIELALIPVIESSLNPWAYSSRHAAGLWQINPPTARHFGLQRSWWYDARYDIPVATETALGYLVSLRDQFEGNWSLALAAYNAGPTRVERALRKAAMTASEAEVADLPLPKQTKNYTPKLLGLLSLIRETSHDDAQWPDTPIEPDWLPVATGGQIELARAAQLAGVDEELLRKMNPAHIRWASGPDAPEILWVPKDSAERLSTALAELPAEDRVRWQRYEIVPGDSLIRIARRFNSQVTLLREVNNLSGNFIRAGDELLIPEGNNWSQSLALASRHSRSTAKPSRYKVRRGDSLWRIARRFDLSVDRLARWNQLSADNYLQPGQTLRLTP